MWSCTLLCFSCFGILFSLATAVSVDSECQKKLSNTQISHLASPKIYTFTDSKKEYQYQLGVCANVVPDTNQAVTQVELTNKLQRVQAVGRLNGTYVISRRDYVELTYSYGDRYHSHCGNTHRTARIMFVCDPCGGRGSPQVIEEFATDSSSSTNSHCFYLFEWATQDVCSKTDGAKFVICKPTGLGLGSIFLIVLLSCGAAYIILGVLFNRCIRGAKGNEQFPHYSFWSTCGDRIADGCDVLCRSKTPSIQMKPIVPSVGRGDHQLDLSGDELE